MSNEQMSIADTAFNGAVAGLVGGAALMLVETLERQILLPRGDGSASMGEQALKAVADSAEAELSPGELRLGGALAQLGYCALVGAVGAVLRSRVPAPAVLDGLGMAALAYTGSMSASGVLPRLGATAPPTAHSVEETAVPIGAYLAYGVTTAAVLHATT